jgi:hypothetical protein
MSECAWVYSARLTRNGGVVVDLRLEDPSTLPDGVASYPTRHEAKAAWKAQRPPRRYIRI